MTNYEKYTTIAERVQAHKNYCNYKRHCDLVLDCEMCFAQWLDMEDDGCEELKPCPFCGGKVHIDYLSKDEFYIECEDCKITTHIPGTTSKKIAIQIWNTRVGK